MLISNGVGTLVVDVDNTLMPMMKTTFLMT